RDVERNDTEVNSPHALDEWDQQNQPRPPRTKEATEAEYDASLVLLHHLDRGGEDDECQDQEGDDDTDGYAHEPTLLLFLPARLASIDTAKGRIAGPIPIRTASTRRSPKGGGDSDVPVIGPGYQA